jgi:hypothetical protein
MVTEFFLMAWGIRQKTAANISSLWERFYLGHPQCEEVIITTLQTLLYTTDKNYECFVANIVCALLAWYA